MPWLRTRDRCPRAGNETLAVSVKRTRTFLLTSANGLDGRTGEPYAMIMTMQMTLIDLTLSGMVKRFSEPSSLGSGHAGLLGRATGSLLPPATSRPRFLRPPKLPHPSLTCLTSCSLGGDRLEQRALDAEERRTRPCARQECLVITGERRQDRIPRCRIRLDVCQLRQRHLRPLRGLHRSTKFVSVTCPELGRTLKHCAQVCASRPFVVKCRRLPRLAVQLVLVSR